MSPSRRKFLIKPLREWSDKEILDLVAKVEAVKHTPEAQAVVEQHMSRGTYARALRRVGLRKPKATPRPGGEPTLHDLFLNLGDALVAVFGAVAKLGGNKKMAERG